MGGEETQKQKTKPTQTLKKQNKNQQKKNYKKTGKKTNEHMVEKRQTENLKK